MNAALEAVTAKLVGVAGPGAVLLAFVLLLATVVRAIPPLFRTKVEADGSLRGDLLARIKLLEDNHAKLETDRVADRERCDAEIASLRNSYDAVIQLLRHRLNNETQSLDSLLMLMEAAPERLAENIARIKAQRAERARVIALEAGAIAGAKAAGKDGA